MKLMQTTMLLVLLGPVLLAQESTTTSVGTGPAGAAKLHSPEILADGRVTFRLFAPKAAAVLVEGNWKDGRDLPMTKDDAGAWSVTTAALQPELWAYTFSVDGVRALDQNNYNVSRDGVGRPAGAAAHSQYQLRLPVLPRRTRVEGLATFPRRSGADALPMNSVAVSSGARPSCKSGRSSARPCR